MSDSREEGMILGSKSQPLFVTQKKGPPDQASTLPLSK